MKKEDLKTLTGREHQVLKLFSKGLTNQEIATELGLSVHTVKKWHMPAIYEKLGFYNGPEDRFTGCIKGRKLMAALSELGYK